LKDFKHADIQNLCEFMAKLEAHRMQAQ